MICTDHSLKFTEHSVCTDYNTWFGFDNGIPPNLLVAAESYLCKISRPIILRINLILVLITDKIT